MSKNSRCVCIREDVFGDSPIAACFLFAAESRMMTSVCIYYGMSGVVWLKVHLNKCIAAVQD